MLRELYGPYTLQEYQTKYGQVSKVGEIVLKAEYLSVMKAKKRVLKETRNKTECHNTNPHHCSSMSRGIIHKKCCINSQQYIQLKKPRQDVQRQPIFIADADHDYILD